MGFPRFAPLLLLLLHPALAHADARIGRRVQADAFSGAARSGVTARCPHPIGRPASGEVVHLSVAPDRARRDEKLVSFIVRLDTGRACILDHGDRTYSELPFPPSTRALAGRFRSSMGRSAADLYPYRADGEVRREAATRGDLELSTLTLDVKSPLLGEKEVSVVLTPDPDRAPAALAVEGFAQAVRNSGEGWLRLFGKLDGLPLSLGEVQHLPSSVVRYQEELSSLDRVVLDPGIFVPPAGYRRVQHPPSCFFVP